MKKLIYIFILIVAYGSSFAQGRKRTYSQYELGFFGGASYYIGDINNRSHFQNSKPAYGVFFRIANNYRTAFRFGLNYGQLAASDSQSKDAFQQERNISFTSVLYEFNATAEFNFFQYRIGNDKHRFTMFVFGGLCVYYFNPVTNSAYSDGVAYSTTQLSVPIGLGFKWNIGKRCGLGLEWGPRRTFTDYLDDVSGTYPLDITSGNSGSPDLSPGVSPGSMRGDPSMKDWYFFYGLTFNIKLPDRHKSCHGTGKGRN